MRGSSVARTLVLVVLAAACMPATAQQLCGKACSGNWVDIRSQFSRQGFGEHDQSSFGDTVDSIAFEWSLGMNVYDIDDAAMLSA